MSDLVPARLRVPCSTSNLGAGYDTIGLALDRYLDVTFEPSGDEHLVVERGGTLGRLDENDEPDLVASTFSNALRRAGVVPGGRLRLHSDVPVARGLGTSAAAILAGYDLARAVRGEPRDDDEAFSGALEHEGHGDNAAPSLFGGLRAVASTPDGPVIMGLSLSEQVGFAYAAPAAGVATREARDLLPRHVPHRVAAASLGRCVALIRGLAEGNPELIRVGVNDELHVPYRLPLIPSVTGAMLAGTEAGAWAVTISGAGSGLIAMCDPECVGFAVRPALEGLRRVDPGGAR